MVVKPIKQRKAGKRKMIRKLLQYSPYKGWENDETKTVNIIITDDIDYARCIRTLGKEVYEDIDEDKDFRESNHIHGIIFYEYYGTMEVCNADDISKIQLDILDGKLPYSMSKISKNPLKFWKDFNVSLDSDDFAEIMETLESLERRCTL